MTWQDAAIVVATGIFLAFMALAATGFYDGLCQP